MTRKLATVRKVHKLTPIEGADKIELAHVDGWQVIVKKGEFKEGNLAVYFEIDSFIPTEVAPFLTREGKQPRTYEGVEGEVLKTIKMKGCLSQGLLLPWNDYCDRVGLLYLLEGEDLTDLLGIKKYEKPIPASLTGKARGNFPFFIRKTDQERIQNIFGKFTQEQIEDKYEVTLKIDGSSLTAYTKDGEHGVCSRNLELKIDESNRDNAYVKAYYDLGIKNALISFKDAALQGELFGSGINGNWENIADHKFMVFDIWSIEHQKYMTATNRRSYIDDVGLVNVPLVLPIGITLEKFKTIDDLLCLADIPSIYNTIAEGIVFKSLTNPNFSFKVINNKFLLTGGN